MVRPPSCLLVMPIAALLGACGDADLPAADASPPSPIAALDDGPRHEGFDSAEDLLAWLQSMSTAADARAMLDLVYAREMGERVLVDYLRQRQDAMLGFDAALRERFPEAMADAPAEDLGIGAFAARIAGAAIERTEGRRAFAPYPGSGADDDSGPGTVVLVRYRDRWWLAPETLSGGEPITDMWFLARQGRLIGVPRAYDRIAAEVRAGDHATLDAARAALETALDGRMPGFGGAGVPQLPGRVRG